MASYGDDATLTKIAVFGMAMSIICTLGIQIMFVETGDYDYDEIQAYKNDLISFSGQSMINDSPWVLDAVYTPWDPDTGVEGHYENGWLYGTKLSTTEAYEDIGKAADIHMDPGHKSSVPITYTRQAYDRPGELSWWTQIPVIGTLLQVGAVYFGMDVYDTQPLTLNNWNYTGYRYVLDPTLPFTTNNETTTSTRDGSLSLVWYSYNGQEGISGGLEIYGGRGASNWNDPIKLASYSAADIIADYNDGSSYATVYDFDFEGTHLKLSIRFNADVIENGVPLMQAWTEGKWSFAISTVSAGNFLDIENSGSYATTMGSMLDTFIKIYTFNLPNFNNEWAAMILWLMVGLPMTIALLCVTMRLMNAIKIL